MEDMSFIDAVSGIVNRGCHNPPCGTGPLDGGYERKENFIKVLGVLFEENGDPRVWRPTESPTHVPTVLGNGEESSEAPPTLGTVNSFITASPTAGGGSSAQATASPTASFIEWIDNDEDEGDWSQNNDEDEEDWSQLGEEGDGNISANLWCGTSQFDATRNCGIGTACPGGTCPGNLKCFMVSSRCDSGSGNNDVGDEVKASAESPTPSPASSSSVPEITTSAPSDGVGLDPFDSFFCGVDRTDASTSCHKRCRSGSSTECDGGMTCFGYTSCTVEAPADPLTPSTSEPMPSPTPQPDSVVYGLCAADYPELQEICWSAKECSTNDPCPDGQMCFENINCDLTAPKKQPTLAPSSPHVENVINNAGIKQNYCAKSIADLEITCVTAETCNPGEPECPTGTYCWGDHLCAGAQEEDDGTVESGKTIDNTGLQQNYCAKSKDDMETSCFNATTCNTDDSQCPIGTYCFANYLCGGVKTTSVPSSLSTKTPTDTPLTAPPTTGTASKPSILQPITQQLFCASSMEELKASCATAQDCSSGPCPKGTLCFPFTCESAVEEKPIVEEQPVIEGQPATSDNKFYCASNLEELEQSCGSAKECDGANPCTYGQFCYSYDCKESPPASDFDLCPLNYVGWHSKGDCKEYYECKNGTAGPIHTCGEGLKFDKVRHECYSDNLVNSYCYGPALESSGGQEETDIPKGDNSTKGNDDNATNQLCFDGYTGWEARSGCREFYWCEDGAPDVIHDCGEDLLFDRELQRCNFADEVVCEDRAHLPNNNPAPTPPYPPTPWPSAKPVSVKHTSFPTFGSIPVSTSDEDKVGGFGEMEWSTTPPSTATQNRTEMPPWLSYSVKVAAPNAGERVVGSVRIWLLVLAPIQWLLVYSMQ